MTKTKNTAKKTQPKSGKSKDLQPAKTAKIDVSALVVSATQMAELLGMTAQNVGALAKRGKIRKNADGTYTVGDTVRAYCEALRGRNAEESKAKESGQETEYWRAAKLRQQSNEGRAEICEELLATLLTVWRATGVELAKMATNGECRNTIEQIFAGFADAVAKLDMAELVGIKEGVGIATEEGQDDTDSD